MAEEAEVQVKLTLDDAASKVADNIKGKFGKLSGVVKNLKGEFMSIAKGALSTALGVSLAPSLQNLAGMFKGMVDQAVDVQGHMRAVAGYFVAGADVAWDAAMDRSKQIDAQLYKASIAIGQNIDDAREAFKNLAMQSDGTVASIDAAAKQTEKLLMFADITGENVRAMGMEWGMMERGMVQTRGKLFKMLYSTGIFGKNLREASSYWAKLTDKQRSESLKKAMDTIYGRFSKAPQTMGSVLSAFDNIKQRLVDIVGMNIIGVLTAKFDNVLKAVEAKRPQLEAIAARFGKFLGAHIEDALQFAGEKLAYLEKNWDEIVKAAEDGAKAIYKVVKFIVRNRDLIFAAYGLNMMAPSISVAMQAAPALKMMMLQLKALAFTSLPAFKTSLTAASIAAGNAALKLGAVAAASLAVYAAFDQYNKLQKEGGLGAAIQELRYGGKGYSKADLTATKDAIAKAIAEGNLKSAAQIMQDKQNTLENRKLQMGNEYGDDAPEHYAGAGIAAMENMLAHYSKTMPTAAEVAFGETVNTQTELVEVYNKAIRGGNEGLATYMANLAGNSESMAYGLNDSSVQIEGGFQAFMDRLGTTTKAFVAKLNDGYADAHPDKVAGKVEAKGASINMNGGQTFNIKQEFRKEDPDRIALFFRKDLVRAATSRTRAKVRTPFGA